MAYERINWQNEPSEATALNDVNLNKMDSAIYELDRKATATDTDIANLQNGKVDKVNGKGLSELSKLTITPDTVEGKFVASIKMYDAEGEQTSVYLRNGVTVDSALSNSSTNPVQNKVVNTALENKVDKEANKGLSEVKKITVNKYSNADVGTHLFHLSYIDQNGLGYGYSIKNGVVVDSAMSNTSENPVQNKAIYDALNNLLPSKTVSGNPISISDASGFDAKELKVTMNPIQDLHGQSAPYPAGGGKNKLRTTLTSGTYGGIQYVVDDLGKIKLNSTPATANSFSIGKANLESGIGYKLSGGVDADFRMYIYIDGTAYTSSGGDSPVFTPSTSGEYEVVLVTAVNATVGDIVSPMIRLSTETDATFAPYSNICPISGRTEASVKRTGINQWDEEWEQGYIDSHGENTASTINIRSKNFIPIVPNTRYYLKSGYTTVVYCPIFFYDENKVFLSSNLQQIWNTVITTPSNAKYMRFYMNGAYGSVYNNDISINYPATDTEYHAYNGETKTVTFDHTVYGGEADLTNGKLSEDMTIVDLGTLNWTMATSGGITRFQASLAGLKGSGNNNIPDNMLCEIYKNNSWALVTGYLNDGQICGLGGGNIIAVQDSRYTDATAFKTAMSGVMLCYELATPTESTFTPQSISLNKGENVISTDGDNVELKYSVSLDSLLPTTTRTLAKSPIVEEPKEETDETEEQR
jgi:hypothetical protein